MRNVFLIARRELATHVTTLRGWIIIGLALFLVALVSVGPGFLASAMSPTQLVSVIVGLVLIIALTTVWWLAHVTDSPMSDVFTELAWYGHFRPFSEGIIHLRHAMYFALFTY